MATTNLNTTASEDSRMAVAFGTFLGLSRNATKAEIKTRTAQWWREVVQDQERLVQTPVAPTAFDPT